MTGQLAVSFRLADKSGPRSRFVIYGEGTNEDWQQVVDGGSNIRLMGVNWEHGKTIKSGISESWDPESLRSYCDACARYGEPYFHFCEWNGTRNSVDAFIKSRGEGFSGMAEAGEYIASEYFGVPDGVMQYMDAVRLASDVEQGKGPLEIRDRVLLCRLLDGSVEVREIEPRDEARISQCMTG